MTWRDWVRVGLPVVSIPGVLAFVVFGAAVIVGSRTPVPVALPVSAATWTVEAEPDVSAAKPGANTRFRVLIADLLIEPHPDPSSFAQQLQVVARAAGADVQGFAKEMRR